MGRHVIQDYIARSIYYIKKSCQHTVLTDSGFFLIKRSWVAEFMLKYQLFISLIIKTGMSSIKINGASCVSSLGSVRRWMESVRWCFVCVSQDMAIIGSSEIFDFANSEVCVADELGDARIDFWIFVRTLSRKCICAPKLLKIFWLFSVKFGDSYLNPSRVRLVSTMCGSGCQHFMVSNFSRRVYFERHARCV